VFSVTTVANLAVAALGAVLVLGESEVANANALNLDRCPTGLQSGPKAAAAGFSKSLSSWLAAEFGEDSEVAVRRRHGPLTATGRERRCA
jgi:hypothetical protein